METAPTDTLALVRHRLDRLVARRLCEPFDAVEEATYCKLLDLEAELLSQRN